MTAKGSKCANTGRLVEIYEQARQTSPERDIFGNQLATPGDILKVTRGRIESEEGSGKRSPGLFDRPSDTGAAIKSAFNRRTWSADDPPVLYSRGPVDMERAVVIPHPSPFANGNAGARD